MDDNNDWMYQDDDFDESLPFVELQFGIEDIHLLYKSVAVHYEKWPGGHPLKNRQDLVHI